MCMLLPMHNLRTTMYVRMLWLCTIYSEVCAYTKHLQYKSYSQHRQRNHQINIKIGLSENPTTLMIQFYSHLHTKKENAIKQIYRDKL